MNWLGQRGSIVAGGLIACAVVVTWQVYRQPESRPREVETTVSDSQPVSHGFVGSSVCAECHAAIAARYQSHPMSHSMSTLEVAGFEESSAAAFTVGSALEYRVERSGDKVWHHELRRDSTGEVIYDQGVEVAYVVGSGTHGKGYLIERDDLLFMSPISWYATRNRWDLSPGYTGERHPRFDRRVTDGCVACHAGRVTHDANDPNRFPEPKFLELSIGCERCHGPGEQHVAARQNVNSQTIHDSIVNPAKLDARRREAVCYQCHLQADYSMLRSGRTFDDFRPGMELEEIVTPFISEHDRSTRESSRFVGQVLQVRESRCHTSSRGKLGCTSCHDPHGAPSTEEKIDFYRSRCLNCHQERGCSESQSTRTESKDSCITCHMPTLPSADVPHASHTDHRIRRRHEPSRESDSLHIAADPLKPFDHWDERIPKADVVRAWGLMFAAEAEKRSSSSQQSALSAEIRLQQTLASHPDDLESMGSLASVLLILKRPQEAEPILEKIIERSSDNEFALGQLALLAHQRQEWPRALDFWKRALERNPWLALNQVQYGQTLVKAGKIEQAIDAAKTALERNPGYLPAQIWLSENLGRAGRPAEAELYRSLAERLKSTSNIQP